MWPGGRQYAFVVVCAARRSAGVLRRPCAVERQPAFKHADGCRWRLERVLPPRLGPHRARVDVPAWVESLGFPLGHAASGDLGPNAGGSMTMLLCRATSGRASATPCARQHWRLEITSSSWCGGAWHARAPFGTRPWSRLTSAFDGRARAVGRIRLDAILGPTEQAANAHEAFAERVAAELPQGPVAASCVEVAVVLRGAAEGTVRLSKRRPRAGNLRLHNSMPCARAKPRRSAMLGIGCGWPMVRPERRPPQPTTAQHASGTVRSFGGTVPASWPCWCVRWRKPRPAGGSGCTTGRWHTRVWRGEPPPILTSRSSR